MKRILGIAGCIALAAVIVGLVIFVYSRSDTYASRRYNTDNGGSIEKESTQQGTLIYNAGGGNAMVLQQWEWSKKTLDKEMAG